MALLTDQHIDDVAGVEIAFAAASAGGDTYDPSDNESILLVRNDSAGSVDVTIPHPGNVAGLSVSDRVVSVAADAVTAIPLLHSYADAGTDNLIDIGYSAATSISVAVVRA